MTQMYGVFTNMSSSQHWMRRSNEKKQPKEYHVAIGEMLYRILFVPFRRRVLSPKLIFNNYLQSWFKTFKFL